MIEDIIKAIFYAGIPLGGFSFLMVYYAYKKGYLSPEITIRNAFKDKHNDDRKLSKKHKKSLVFFHSKWIGFGGGFYGLVALVTFIYIEIKQMVEFLIGVTGVHSFLDLLTLNALIGMFIDSIMNMIKAAIWFTYWPNVFDMSNFFIWILIAYLGYRLGANIAQKQILKQSIDH
ncbi:MAG: hypothetical protein ACI9LM_000729 [Alteromonadaceae bacterium]|jgi:hypothetical protein